MTICKLVDRIVALADGLDTMGLVRPAQMVDTCGIRTPPQSCKDYVLPVTLHGP